MLDERLPYHLILERLGDAGKHLNFQNLSNWKNLGGYQDWRTRKLRKIILDTALGDTAGPDPPARPVSTKLDLSGANCTY